MDTGSFVYDIETEDFYRDIAKDVEKRFYTSGYSRVYTYRKIDKEVEQKRCKGKKNVGLLNALILMIIIPTCMMEKHYVGSKCCLRIRSTRCTQSISIR